jgi:hypothetical protein
VCSSVDELIAGASHREPFVASDSKSGAPLERVVIDGEPMVLKHIHVDRDWIMRFIGDIGCNPLLVWQRGLMDVVADRIDHATVGAAAGLGRNGWGGALLMRDRSDVMIPAGDSVVPIEMHEQFFGDMAALAACFWGWTDDVGLTPLENRVACFGPDSLAIEADNGWPEPVPKIGHDGWARFSQRAPRDLAAAVDWLRHDCDPLVSALKTTPLTFVHGDWKLGNLGVGHDGRTVLIDWAMPGEAPCCYDLVWYLAVNNARLALSKEAAVACYRGELEANGIDTAAWFDKQLALSMLTAVVMFGWEKAFGTEEEFGWWCDRAREGAAYL